MIPGMCDKDIIVVNSILHEWLELSSDRKKRSSNGWEPMWGEVGVFNGMLQQGDCGYAMCSENCARLASDYLNELSKQHINSFIHRDKHGCLRGACTSDPESCEWCTGFTSYDDNVEVCDTCGCSFEKHEVVFSDTLQTKK